MFNNAYLKVSIAMFLALEKVDNEFEFILISRSPFSIPLSLNKIKIKTWGDSQSKAKTDQILLASFLYVSTEVNGHPTSKKVMCG